MLHIRDSIYGRMQNKTQPVIVEKPKQVVKSLSKKSKIRQQEKQNKR